MMTEEARQARNTYARQWRAKNKEKLRNYYALWRAANQEKVKQYQRDYWERKVQKCQGV